MIDNLVMEYFSLSEKLRNGYRESLGIANPKWNEILSQTLPIVPKVFQSIYRNVSGTYANIENQKYMDFVPGYRLIHITELGKEYCALSQMLVADDICRSKIEPLIPLLADYSSCYICYAVINNNAEVIFHYSPTEGLQKMHTSVESFLKTIIAFYLNGVFYLDKDGFLDYDFEKEGSIGAEYNPGVDYWIE